MIATPNLSSYACYCIPPITWAISLFYLIFSKLVFSISEYSFPSILIFHVCIRYFLFFLIFIYFSYFPCILFILMNTTKQLCSESRLFTSNNRGKTIQVDPLNLDQYRYEETYARVDQIMNSRNPLRDIDKLYCSRCRTRPVATISTLCAA